ncbi:MAG: helix-turn-helix domain-containing protein [Candidatus Limnocylindrales bacterium]
MTRSVFSSAYVRMRGLLVDARRSSGVTQAELARRLNRPQSFVAKYERGERRLDLVEFLEVVAALDLDAAPIVREVAAEIRS